MNDKAIAALKEVLTAHLLPLSRLDTDDILRRAIAAYEAAMWRPVSEHDGSSGVVMLEYETPNGDLRAEPAWYEADEMQRGWREANLDWSDHSAETFERHGCVPKRFRPLPANPGERGMSASDDRRRMDWLAMQIVRVDTPLRWGSRENFIATPGDSDGEDEPSDLRAQIDAAMKKDSPND